MTSETDASVSFKTLPAPPLVLGYPTLASYMGATPELMIFRRFADLNTQTLLYYQAELFNLESQLRELELNASGSDRSDPRSRFSRDWEWLSGEVDLTGKTNDQMRIVLRIRILIREYSKHNCETAVQR